MNQIISIFCCTLMACMVACHPQAEKPASTHKLTMVETSGTIVPPDEITPPLQVPVDTNKLQRNIAGPPDVIPMKRNNIIPFTPQTTLAGNPKVTSAGTGELTYTKSYPAVRSIVKAGIPDVEVAKDMGNKFQNPGNFSFLNKAQGLRNNIYVSLLEDRSGNLWFGADRGGVVKYDGESFSFYSDKQGLPFNYILSILEDSTGSIWFAGHNGISSFDGNHFNQYTTLGSRPISGRTMMIMDSNSKIWMANEYLGLMKLDGSVFYQYLSQDSLDDNVSCLIEDHLGNIWTGSWSGGIRKFDGKQFHSYTEKEGLPSNKVVSVAEDAHGHIWIGHYGGGLTKFDGTSFHQYKTKGEIPNDYFWTIQRGHNGIMWFGTDRGAIKYDGQLFTNLSETEGLSSNFIWDIMEDRNRQLWFATYGGGVSKYAGDRFTHLTKTEGLSVNVVTSLLEDRKGDVWLGTWAGYLIKSDGEKFYHYAEKQGLTNFNVWTMHEDRQGNIWLGTDAGVYRFDGKTFLQLTEKNGLATDVLKAIHQDHTGTMWFGTWSGLSSFDGNSVTTYTTKQGLTNSNVLSLHEDRSGKLWIGTKAGVTCFDKNQIIRYDTSSGLSLSDVERIYEDDMGNLWFGTSTGAVNYDGKKFTWLTTKEGLLNNTVVSITQDSVGNYVFGTRFGLSILTKNKLAELLQKGGEGKINEHDVFFKNFGYEDGFLGVGCNRNSMMRTKDGSVWIGTNDRLTIFHPESLESTIDSFAPKIQLTSIELFNEKIPWAELEEHKDTNLILANGVTLGNFSFSGLSSWYSLPNDLRLAHNNNYLTFQFIGITTHQPEKVKYQYVLEGIDPDWSALTSRSYATYGNLPHGSYTFKVKAMSPDGYWSEQIDYSFTIRPPWWLTWWMYILYAVMIIGGIMGFTKWRVRTLRRRFVEVESINKKLSDLTQTQQNTLSLFIKYVPETVVKRALEDRPDSIFEGEQQEVAVLFCDIRGFTEISEKLNPNQVVSVLNTYYAGMNEVIRHHGGVINQFVGDEIFVIFGAPVPLIDIEHRAVHCAMGMIEKLKVINRELYTSLGLSISVGIGINFGPVVTGNLGCEDRISYSVTGDTVNTANRIESLTRDKPNSILISESVYAKVHHQISTHAWEPVIVKGKNEKLKVYEVMGRVG